jgi:hypothetical protein
VLSRLSAEEGSRLNSRGTSRSWSGAVRFMAQRARNEQRFYLLSQAEINAIAAAISVSPDQVAESPWRVFRGHNETEWMRRAREGLCVLNCGLRQTVLGDHRSRTLFDRSVAP